MVSVGQGRYSERGGHDGDRTALGEPGLGGADDRERGGSNKEKKWIKTGK